MTLRCGTACEQQRALALREKGIPVPKIANKLTIKTGVNAGKSPSLASVYRVLAEVDTLAKTN